MQFGLMIISAFIANLHAAVFYVQFIWILPYFAEYILIFIRDSKFMYKLKIYDLKHRIEKVAKKEGKLEKLEVLQAKLLKVQGKLEKAKENSKKREENSYKIRLERRDAVKWLILITILCLAMGLLTPIGDEPYTHIFKLLSGTTTQSISEHQPLVLWGHTSAITVFMIIFGLLIFTDVKISLKDLFMLGGLIILTFSARRQVSLLLIIGVFSITRLICYFVNKHDKNVIEKLTKFLVTWKGKVLVLLFIVICSFLSYRNKIDDEYISSSSYPVQLADFMVAENEAQNLDFKEMRLYNDYNYGSYLLFRGIPVFIDSRADLYSPEFNEGCSIFDDYMNISNIAVYYEDKFSEYGITHVVTYQNSKLNLLLSRDDRYKQLYSDRYFILYERLSVITDNVE